MIKIMFSHMFIFITLIWFGLRIFLSLKNKKTDLTHEIKLLTVYICLIVIIRITFFPWHLINGQIQPLIFDANKIFPPKINLIPVVHLFDIYDGWQRNLFGNMAMFVPVGLVLPFCFKKLDNFYKVVLAGSFFSLSIELIQLFFYERSSDIDDLITNTIGTMIGASIYFLANKIFSTKKQTTNPI